MPNLKAQSEQLISTLRPEQIREAAKERFVADGFDAVSMDRIARAAGVSKRTPYIYFENKHDLFSAVVLDFLRDLEAHLNTAWADPLGIDAIAQGMALYADYALADPARLTSL